MCGISKEHLGALINELSGPWLAVREAGQGKRRGHARLRVAGAGPDHQLVFADRVLVTLVALRWALSHRVLAVLFGVSASTVDRAVAEILPFHRDRTMAQD
ncbi:transposase family protein [Streptomyces sp. RKAG293]|uniref:helix-turn-helix domain-containing protein n=1 Tax=Streptomyces sp. RKAG293 TaxID=2893403 RepID=UPI00203432C4|nr:transposase family protein [Streptomyces sp. RKAG293]MCM2419079.1 transposase family protein [Streptomyces sp. RKAG293]